MKPLLALMALATIFSGTLTGCAVARSKMAESLPGYSFNYAVENARAVDLVQVFDDGRRTYVQFSVAPSNTVKITDSAGNELNATRNGQYLVLPGRYAELIVSNHDESARVLNRAGPGRFGPGEAATPRIPLQGRETDQGQAAASKTQIAALERELALAKAQLALYASNLVIHFANNSARVDLDHQTLATMATLLSERKHIVVAGYTDANYRNPAGAKLAQRRALNVKKALVACGVDVGAIRVAYYAAGSFAADNRTAAGKALNRRVEIIASQ